MRILVGAMIALVLALGFTGWQLKRSWDSEAATRERLAGVTGALERANEENERLEGRMDAFDEALGRLGLTVQQNQRELTSRLTDIQTITEEPTDDPQSLACLDLPVPAQLDRGLREPAAATR